MLLNQLVNAQRGGSFSPSDSSTVDDVIIGGNHLTRAQCDTYMRNVGWTGRCHINSLAAVKKTDSFLKTIRQYLEDPYIAANADIQFEAIRMNDKEKIVDRITFVTPTQNFSIIHGMPGLGAWALVDNTRVAEKTKYKGRSFKSVLEYINENGI